MEDVLEEARWPVGGGPVLSGGATGWRDGRGVVRLTGAPLVASGVEGAGRPSSSISTSSSPSEEADDLSDPFPTHQIALILPNPDNTPDPNP